MISRHGYPPQSHRRHPAATSPRARLAARQESIRSSARVKPQSIEEAKENLRIAAARRAESDSSALAGNDLASAAVRFVKDHPAAIAAGVGVVALVIGPGTLIKGAATAARLATLAGFLGKAAR
ncbi:MAG: hypothetical protein RIE32_13605 [Phycisphaerales bacterium]